MKKISTLGLGLFVGLTTLASNAMAADPAWFTDLTTQLTGIQVMVLAVLGSVIAISLAPLAWGFVRKVLHRG
ncbi:hypothetical protein [Sulfurospirillum arsenophilum]|uniref:hypothetical protein n=1 Tax=Sulfurospirillum arsenophilum TaxID=56698 RepID=UPI0005AB352C|nr:hypothetical protein [Sulfurospirillum arsenophilum]